MEANVNSWIYKCFFIFGAFLIIILSGCSAPIEDTQQEPLKIHFVGDSFTVYYNAELPEMFSRLAEIGDHQVNVSRTTRDATSLAFHSRNKNLISKIEEGELHYVILQETEKIPSIPEDRDNYFFPIVRSLNSMIQENGAQTVLYMTWGYRDGFPEGDHPTYASMQNAIAESNLMIADELEIPVAPVGIAWQTALERDPELDLWVKDGGHPTPTGMLLAASVFYAVIFDQDPTQLPYSDEFGIEEETIKVLHSVASEVVLENKNDWNLP